MQTAKLTITLEVDGSMVPGFPITRRMNLDEIQSFTYEKASDTAYTDIPATEVLTQQLVILQSTQPVTVRLDAQSDKGIRLSANSILIVLDATLDAIPVLQVFNNSGSISVVKGVVGGT